MFTGIIEELGTVKSIQQSKHAMEICIAASNILEDIKLGDSIAVNGVCLTVTSFTTSDFIADVMPETIKSTSLNLLTNGSKVNLERAMQANGRFGGHFVSGHVDGTAIILRKRPLANAVYIDLQMSEELLEHCIEKGSITIDGTSLTIFKIDNHVLTISLIPHTYSETVLGIKKVGDIVNIETDMLGKYIAKYMKQQQKSSISLDFLKQAGF